MEYDWKQLGAKVAKVGFALLATAGTTAAFGGTAIPIALTVSATFIAETIAQGFGELAEGMITGISPKGKGVLDQLIDSIQKCVDAELVVFGCSRNNKKIIVREIMKKLFSIPLSNTLILSMDAPKDAVSCVRCVFYEFTIKYQEDDLITFVDSLFSRICIIIDNNHEFTTFVYLKKIDKGVNDIMSTVNKTHQQTEYIADKISNLLESEERNTSYTKPINKQAQITMIQKGENSVQIAPVYGGVLNINVGRTQKDDSPIKSKYENSTINTKFKFIFNIDNNGNAREFSTTTSNALREWFYDYARADLSDCNDSALINTFAVEIVDERILKSDEKFTTIWHKVRKGEPLSVQDDHFYSVYMKQGNKLGRDNKVKIEALRFCLSNRDGHNALYIFDWPDLCEIILDILNFPYSEINKHQSDSIMLDVFLNSDGCNEKYERFIASIKKEHLVSLFGGCSMYDINDRTFMDLGIYRREIAPYFYFHIAELKLFDSFDFSIDNRVTNLLHYWIGLH